ncbi:hypothetical protein KW782_04025 [Candidatus Parcubacteria bacterium]|nr:hypothetical protein [Candidatus Parcubacteria bacterium]
MTPEEKLQKIKEAQERFHQKVGELRKQYILEIQKVNRAIDTIKIETLKRGLHS